MPRRSPHRFIIVRDYLDDVCIFSNVCIFYWKVGEVLDDHYIGPYIIDNNNVSISLVCVSFFPFLFMYKKRMLGAIVEEFISSLQSR